STSEYTWLGSMSAGDGSWTAVFSGTANRLAATGAAAGVAAASLDGSNCQGVSGDAGAKSRVSLQAPSSAHPANALRRNRAGGMQCPRARPGDRRLRLWPTLGENVANVLVRGAVPGGGRCQLTPGAGSGRRPGQPGCHLARSLAAARPRRGLPKPARQFLV